MERERGKETVSLLQKFVALANEIQESQSSSDPAPLRANDVPEPCPRPASPATGASQTPDSNSYTAEEYLSRAKVFTPAKKKFRVCNYSQAYCSTALYMYYTYTYNPACDNSIH